MMINTQYINKKVGRDSLQGINIYTHHFEDEVRFKNATETGYIYWRDTMKELNNKIKNIVIDANT